MWFPKLHRKAVAFHLQNYEFFRRFHPFNWFYFPSVAQVYLLPLSHCFWHI